MFDATALECATIALEGISAGSFLALAAIFFGYPLAIHALSVLRPRPYPVRTLAQEAPRPRVAILMAAHNEAARLPPKLKSLQALDYPRDKIRIYIADDASTDDTSKVLAALQKTEDRLVVVRSPQNVGKPTNLNRLVKTAEDDFQPEVLVFNDARQPLAPSSLEALLAPLQDPTIGGATGDLILPPRPDGSIQGMGAYWKYETWIRTREALSGSVVGATGALYAVRRRSFVPFEPELVLDDMLLPLRVVLGGERFVFARGAQAYDVYSRDLRHESQRKARTLGGIYQAMSLERRLLRPGSGVFLRFFFHKFGRLLFPWLMVSMFLASALAAALLVMQGSWWRAIAQGSMLLGHVVFYGGVLTASVLTRVRGSAGPLNLFRTLFALQSASWRGWRAWRRGEVTAAWKRREEGRP